MYRRIKVMSISAFSYDMFLTKVDGNEYLSFSTLSPILLTTA